MSDETFADIVPEIKPGMWVWFSDELDQARRRPNQMRDTRRITQLEAELANLDFPTAA